RVRPGLQPGGNAVPERCRGGGMRDHRRSGHAGRPGGRPVGMVDRTPASCRPDARGGDGPFMKLTSFEAFSELAQRGTFVPVVKEIVADLLTPVSAFLKIAEHSDYAFLLESVEGGEHVGRYSFLGKDPFVTLRSRNGKTIIERGGETKESPEPYIEVLRKMMADFRSPFVPELPRFTGGAVGYL